MKHILLVDDVATNLKCEELILRNQYQVTMVKSGREALACLQTVIPDLVLLDIRMHEMDGYEVLKHMKEDPKTAAVPVILLTADTEQESEERGIALGAIDFIRKPIEPQLLLERIEAVWGTEE
ncbi:MAG: response regulator [Lachnospiraceae bacterium]|nr:response regulator [Lachnospiraceae bacterium]